MIPLILLHIALVAQMNDLTECKGWSGDNTGSFFWCRNKETENHWFPVTIEPRLDRGAPEWMHLYRVIHMPAEGCPRGYKRSDSIFTNIKTNRPNPACISENPNASGTDYLAGYESEALR